MLFNFPRAGSRRWGWKTLLREPLENQRHFREEGEKKTRHNQQPPPLWIQSTPGVLSWTENTVFYLRTCPIPSEPRVSQELSRTRLPLESRAIKVRFRGGETKITLKKKRYTSQVQIYFRFLTHNSSD